MARICLELSKILNKSFWICKGDLNKHYDGNRNPIQSFLFCIKSNLSQFFFFAGKTVLRWIVKCKHFGVSFVERKSVLSFNRKTNLTSFFSSQLWKQICVEYSYVHFYCSMKNNVKLIFIFRPFRTDIRIRSSRSKVFGWIA